MALQCVIAWFQYTRFYSPAVTSYLPALPIYFIFRKAGNVNPNVFNHIAVF